MGPGRHLPVVGQRFDLDIIEKFTVVGLLTFFAARLVPPIYQDGAYLNLILLAAEGMVVVFVLFRRPTQAISHNWLDWLTGFGATALPLCVGPADGPAVIPAAVAGAVMTSGMALSIAAKLVLRRSFGIVAANRGVKVSGPYRLVRHPMYLGYAVHQMAFLLSGVTLWNAAVYALVFGLQVARILAEERALVTDVRYQELCAKVRYRVIPFVF